MDMIWFMLCNTKLKVSWHNQPQLLFARFWNLLLCCSKVYKVIKLFSDVIEQCVLFVIISTSEVGTHLQKNYFSVSMFCNSFEQSLLTL